MSSISMKALLEAGVHFGHQVRRWNPKMAKYIYGSRNNIHIIDLQKTVKELKRAYKYVRDEVASGKQILFIGTKKQAQESIKSEAQRCQAAYVSERWLGGGLTNFETVKKSIARLREIEKMKDEGIFKVLSKKEVSRLSKEYLKLDKSLSGLKDLKKLPDLVFIIDPVQEITAVKEARILGIPVVAVCDTNCDPDLIDYPVPGNDDAIRAVKLFCSIVADAVLEGRNIAVKQDETQASEGTTLADTATIQGIPEDELAAEEKLGGDSAAESAVSGESSAKSE